MRLHDTQLSILALVGTASALPACTTETFAACLPPGASIVSAVRIESNGTFQVPASDIAYPTSPTGLKASCAIQVHVISSNSSAYDFGVFLPDEWNERTLTVGNGGFAGGINWLDMGPGVGYGFASISTDTGHNSTSGDGTWALNEPEKRNDWGYRAIHGSYVLGKEIATKYYGSSPKYNYYSGCSTGGRQGLRDLQLYPDDFDGVLAGAPAWWTSHLQTWTVKIGLYNLPVDSPGHITVPQFALIEKEILRQCDPQDGMRDNIISDPRGCNVDLNTLLCTSANSTGCFNQQQIQTLTNIYTDYIDTNQTFVFHHLEPGSESQWVVLLGGAQPASLGTQYVQDFLLNDPAWSPSSFNYSIVALADELKPGNATADVYDISPFQARGGKLLMYHGEADALIATGSSPYYYSQVYRTLTPRGVRVTDFFRLFLVPGMQHCAGTPALQKAPWYFAGANQAGVLGTGVHSTPGFADARHDALLALMAWVEGGEAPDEIVATRWVNDTVALGVERQRPLCVYPQQARYTGGDVNAAESWTCRSLYDP